MVRILSGETIARRILGDLKRKKARKTPSLLVVQVGKNPVSAKYVGEKEKVAKELGIIFRLVVLPANISQTELEHQIQKIGKSPKVTGMIVQLPLPSALNTQAALDRIPLEKDVDVLSSAGFGAFALETLNILPPTVHAVSLLLRKAKANLKGSNVVVLGAGRLVGLPLSLWLLQQGATLTVVNKQTKNLKSITQKADILISGTGKRGLVRGNMVKKGAVVIDAGTSVEAGKSAGDVDFKTVSKKAGFITPVPGGVGPLTVACLFQNLFLLTERGNRAI